MDDRFEGSGGDPLLRGVRDYRHREGLKQATLARKSGVSQQVISGLESQGWYLSEEKARALAPVFGVEPDELKLSHDLYVIEALLREDRMDASELLSAANRSTKLLPLTITDEQRRTIWRLYTKLLRTAFRKFRVVAFLSSLALSYTLANLISQAQDLLQDYIS